MSLYRKKEITRVLRGKVPFAGIYKIKIKGDRETKWMNLSRNDVKKLRKVL